MKLLLKFLNPVYRNFRLILAALITAGVIHICAALTYVSSNEVAGYTRIAAGLPPNQVNYLSETTPENQRLPFMMPDTLYAVCRFDASYGIVRIRAEIPAPGWSLSMHAPNGDNFLFVPGKADRITKLNIEVNPNSKTFETKSIGQLDNKKKSPLITIKFPHGLAIFRAPVNALALRRKVDEQLNSFKCYTDRGARSR